MNKGAVYLYAMESELALQRLSEAREVLDGETAEMVDALARVIMLQQDIRSPMLGAKVTLWLRPPHTSYSEAEIVDPEDAPDPQSEEWNWQWSATGNGEDEEPTYRFRAKDNPEDPDLVPHKALVIEGNVGESAPEGELWDPNDGEYRTADEYPLGTINCVVAQDYHGDELIDFEDDYPTDVEVHTSITPADGEPSNHQYTPGWPVE